MLLKIFAAVSAVAALAASSGRDLSRCAAYSDSVNDVPMLSMVGTAVAINPDRRLRRVATERGWSIRDYRRLRRNVFTVARWTVAAGSVSAATAGAYLAWTMLRSRRDRPR